MGMSMTTAVSAMSGMPSTVEARAIAQGTRFSANILRAVSVIFMAAPLSSSILPRTQPKITSRPTLARVLPKPSMTSSTVAAPPMPRTRPRPMTTMNSVATGWTLKRAMSRTRTTMAVRNASSV